MKEIMDFVKNYSIELTLASALIAVTAVLLVVLNYVRTTKIIKRYRRLMRGSDNKSLEAMLHKHLDTIQSGLDKLEDIESELKNQNARLKNCIQNVGIVRYNAFDQMGGDQSFSVAMLDDRGDGFVITSLYGRSTSTSFAKPVKLRQSTYPLTDEEKEAIERSFHSLNS